MGKGIILLKILNKYRDEKQNKLSLKYSDSEDDFEFNK